MSEPSDSISIVWNCTPGERRQAAALLAGRAVRPLGSPARRIRFSAGLFGWLLLISLCLLLNRLVHQPAGPGAASPPEEMTPHVKWSIGAFALGAAMLVLGRLILSRWRQKFANRWQDRLTYSFDEAGVRQQRPGRTASFDWAYFDSFSEGPDVMVLRKVGQREIVLPWRLFADERECQRVRGLLHQNVVRPAIPVDGDSRSGVV